MLAATRTSGRKRQAKILFVTGPIKEDLALSKKCCQGADRMWKRRRNAEALDAALAVPTACCFIPKTGTKKQRMNTAVKKVMNKVYSNQLPKETKAGLLLASIEDGTMYGDSGKAAVRDMATAIGRDLYSPYRVAWAMAESGSLSGENLSQL
eukprot:scaffold103475_cov67-Attheya_sp.AAC.2